MFKYVVLCCGLLLAFLLLGHLALNATSMGPVDLERSGPGVSKTSGTKNSSTILSAEALQAKAAEEALHRIDSRFTLSGEQRKELEEAALLAGLDPNLVPSYSDSELIEALRNTQRSSENAANAAGTVATPQVDPAAANTMLELQENEALKKSLEAGVASVHGESGNVLSEEAQKVALEAELPVLEAPVFEAYPLEEEHAEVVAEVSQIEALLQRIDRGEELTDAEKDVVDANLTDPLSDDRGRDGSLNTTGGPDAYGYSFVDNLGGDTATYDWVELKGDPLATFLTQSGTDAGTSWFVPGFSFPFYGVFRDTIRVSNDGNLQFVTSSTSYTNDTLPSTNIAGPMIALFWDDQRLNSFGGTVSDRIMYRSFGTYAVIEWDSTAHYNTLCDSMALKYEAILYNSGKIKMQYNQVGSTGTCDSSLTVGIQSNGAAGSTALNYCFQYSSSAFNGVHPAAGRAIWFNPTEYDSNFATSAITSPSATGIYGPSEVVSVTATFMNVGAVTQTTPVKYSFNGGGTVEETSASLAQWATDPHTFATTITMPATTGSYPLTVWCDHAGDENRLNDTLRINVQVFVGGSCASAIDITTAGPDSATYNNCGAGTNDPGVPCTANSYDDMVFKRTVDPGRTITFWIKSLAWTTKYPDAALRWGGACPGTNLVDCIATTTIATYSKEFTWTNSTGSTQDAYFVVGHYSGTTSSYCGNFKLAWKDQLCAAVDPPLAEGFESPTVPNLPNCWTSENVNGLAPLWESYATNPRTGAKCGTIGPLTAGNNDWMYSPGINMEEGRDYFVSYWRRVGSATYPDSLEVKAGLAPTVAAMTITVAAMDTCKSIVYVNKPGGFTCPASGVYYIGWHNVAVGSSPRTYIDDISVAASDSCHGGTVTVNAAIGADSVTLAAVLGGSWYGGTPNYQWYTGDTCAAGNEIVGATTSTYKTYAPGSFSCRVYVISPDTCVACDSAYADVVDCATGTYGMSQTFESVTTPALPVCWRQENLDTYTYTWVTGTTYPHSGTKDAQVYGYVSDGSAPNDWLYTRALQLASDTLYHLGYWYKLSSTSYTRMLEVNLGTAQNFASMNVAILDTQFTLGSTTYDYRERTFQPPSTGIYFIGFHATSPTTQSGYIAIDDIAVFADGACTPPTSVTVNSVVRADSARLKAVTLGGTGGGYQYQWYTGENCATGNEIAGATTDSLWVLTSGIYSCKAYIVDDVDCAVCDSAYAEVVDCDITLTLPVLEGFEATTDTLLPVCWQYVDVNADNRHWKGFYSASYLPRTGMRNAYCTYSSGTAANDWLFSRGIALTGGDTIVVDYWYRCYLTGTSYSESLELLVGTAPDVVSMTTIVDTNFTFTAVATYQQRSGLFVVPATGTYYFGWHAGYLINQGGVMIDDINIYEYGVCAAPTVDVPAVSNQGYVILTCGVTGGFGGPIQYQWYTGEACQTGNEIAGANGRQYLTYSSGVFSCMAWFYNPLSCGACDSALATVIPDPCLPGGIPPIYEPWASTSLPTCWSQENGNNDSYSWNYSSTYYYSSPYAAYLYTSTTPANDWLFSGPVQLVQDTTYRIEYYRRASSTSYTQTLSLYVGTVRYSSAMTTQLLAPYSFNSTTWVKDFADYVAPATGSYYFSLRNVTTVSSGSVYADDFRIYKLGSCGAPTTVTVNSASGPYYATLSCAATGGFGGPYQYQWYTGETCNPVNAIVGATNQSYDAATSGIYACKAYVLSGDTCGTCDSATATVIDCAPGDYNGWPTPFTEGFETTTGTLLPDCWRAIDVNNDARPWRSNTSYPHTGARHAYNQYSTGTATDDWMFTKGLVLTAGDTMEIRYWYRCALSSSSYNESLELRTGTAQTIAAMTTIVDPNFQFTQVSAYVERTCWFVVPASGSYFFGWHAGFLINQGGVCVDDITIYKRGTCVAPTLADIPAVEYPAWVTLTANASGGFGSPIQYQWFTGVGCTAGNEIGGANTSQYTTAVSGIFSCKVWRDNADTCAVCDSAEVTITAPQAGEICSNALTLTPPASNDSTVVTGNTSTFFMHCTETCGTSSSWSPDIFYTMTIPGSGDGACRRITMVATGGDMFLTLYDGLANCCVTPLYCNDDDAQFSPLPPWDVAAQHPGWPYSYIAAELYPGTYLIRVGMWQDTSGAYALKVYDNGPCYAPCLAADSLTVTLSAVNPTKVWLHFNAPSTGTYNIFSTTFASNDGDPNNGLDPQWSLDTTYEVATPGQIEWNDLRAWVAYRNYSVVHDCPILGRCCYGPLDTLCANNTQPECEALSGTWNRYVTCESNPCVVGGDGETCETSIWVTAFPYTVTGASTEGYANDYILYADSPVCLSSSQSSYGNGFDVIYKITLTTTTNLTFLYGCAVWGSLTVHNACPAQGTCIAGIKDPSTTWHDLVIPCRAYDPGTYYVMVDSWTGYDPYTYNLTIQTCTP